MIKGLVFLLILNLVVMTSVWWQVYHLRSEVVQTIHGAQNLMATVEKLQIPEERSKLFKNGLEGIKQFIKKGSVS
jgi:hypothetical protein